MAMVVGNRGYDRNSKLCLVLRWRLQTCVKIILSGGTQKPGVQDTQCGFKLITTVTGELLYLQQNLKRWTHDVELL